MANRSIIVRADWDDEAQVWVATSNDIDGLAIESDTLEALGSRVIGAVTDLMELNGHDGDDGEIPVRLMVDQVLRVPPRIAA